MVLLSYTTKDVQKRTLTLRQHFLPFDINEQVPFPQATFSQGDKSCHSLSPGKFQVLPASYNSTPRVKSPVAIMIGQKMYRRTFSKTLYRWMSKKASPHRTKLVYFEYIQAYRHHVAQVVPLLRHPFPLPLEVCTSMNRLVLMLGESICNRQETTVKCYAAHHVHRNSITIQYLPIG